MENNENNIKEENKLNLRIFKKRKKGRNEKKKEKRTTSFRKI